MIIAGIIMGGIVAITAIIWAGILIDAGKLSLKLPWTKLEAYDSQAVFEAKQQTEVAKANVQTEFYKSLEERVLALRGKEEDYNHPPIDEALIKLIFGKNPGVVKAEIEAPKKSGDASFPGERGIY